MRKDIHRSPQNAGAQMLATLYLGANIPGHVETVDDESFAAYLTHVTPHFPGFTVQTCEGYWKGQPETVRILSILMTDHDSGRAQIRMFAEQYKTMFAQEAVAYSFTPADFTLDCWPFGPVKTYHTAGKGY